MSYLIRSGGHENPLVQELLFWEQFREDIFIYGRTPSSLPDIKQVKKIISHFNRNKDYYTSALRIKELKNQLKHK